jgi:hypothetical protein
MKLQALTQAQAAEMGSFGSLVGYVTTTRAQLEEVFGAPTYSEESWDGKVTTEWVLVFPDGTRATIYDWKRYEEGAPTMNEEYEWHIGGNSRDIESLVQDYLK